jgi:cell pole-organizing protein PopZ
MGDISSEPSMEEILSSIKRIIAEEGDAAIATRTRRGGRATTAVAEKSAAIDEVLELSQPVDDDDILETPTPMSMGSPTPPKPVLAEKPARVAPAAAAPVEAPAEPIVSDTAAQAMRGPLEALSRMVKPAEAPTEILGTDTIEGLVRAMLKPMLSEWLDANLPRLVEDMVAKEISRITGRQ